MSVEQIFDKIIEIGGELSAGENLSYKSIKQESDFIIKELIKQNKQEILAYFEANNLRKISGLSYTQKSLWYMHQVNPNSADYNLGFAVYLSKKYSKILLENTLDVLLSRYEILKSIFVIGKKEPIQQTLSNVKHSVSEINCTKEINLHHFINELVDKPFKLSEFPLFKIYVLNTEDSLNPTRILVLKAHHIIFDYSSFDIFCTELIDIYIKLLHNEQDTLCLANKMITYHDYILKEKAYLLSQKSKEAKEYWMQQYADVQFFLNLPYDIKNRSEASNVIPKGVIVSKKLPKKHVKSIKALAKLTQLTPNIVVLTALNLMLADFTGQNQIVIGMPVSSRMTYDFEHAIGPFLNTVLLKQYIQHELTFGDFLLKVKENILKAIEYKDYPLLLLMESLNLNRDAGGSLFQVIYIWNEKLADSNLLQDQRKVLFENSFLEPQQRGSMADLILMIEDDNSELIFNWSYNASLFSVKMINKFHDYLINIFDNCMGDINLPLIRMKRLTDIDINFLSKVSVGKRHPFVFTNFVELFEQQSNKTPNSNALLYKNDALTFSQLNDRSNIIANLLQNIGVELESRVGILCERGFEMVIAMLAISKIGGCYIPMDPSYPPERISYIINDSQMQIIISDYDLQEHYNINSSIKNFVINKEKFIAMNKIHVNKIRLQPENLAYIIYTSGSTGDPKGVMVTHKNITNFIISMNSTIRRSNVSPQNNIWLATTSIAFDISFLEIFWSLLQGHAVYIEDNKFITKNNNNLLLKKTSSMDFSLFYFSSDSEKKEENRYQFLFNSSILADKLNFKAVWVPERHFHVFGGNYPNPSVVAAALASMTKKIAIRAGSVVTPLHHPVRIAEEWAVVDNISHGRVGISFASGWQPDDFILAPSNYDNRKEKMLQDIEVIRKLWRGESVKYLNGVHKETAINILPLPIQNELPYWITAATSLETFRIAGECGANLLTHMLGQNIRELKDKIIVYKEACINNGHKPGTVTLMLHTFIDDDMAFVTKTVKKPFKNYLRSSIGLMQELAKHLSLNIAEHQELIVEQAFQRYFGVSSLFGTPETCAHLIRELESIGVNEIACLIDFGIEDSLVLKGIQGIENLRKFLSQETNKVDDYFTNSIGKNITHLQCTPSHLKMLLDSDSNIDIIKNIKQMLIGGEPVTEELLLQLRKHYKGDIYSVYGPTETTIWSAVKWFESDSSISTNVIGKPILNTDFYILNENFEQVPVGIIGEMYISGEGLARGYWKKAELTASSFLPHPYTDKPGERIYKTGDLVRYTSEETLEFIGRNDHQVKIRGYRIELGEIESTLNTHEKIDNSVVLAILDKSQTYQLVAYVAVRKMQLEQKEILNYLKAKLPKHMLPSTFIILNQLPLTPNGKIDKNLLRSYKDFSIKTEQRNILLPRNEIEEKLKVIWENLLDNQHISVQDNFFDIGGHSLLAAKLQQRMVSELLCDISIVTILTYPSIRSLATYLIDNNISENITEKHDLQNRVNKQKMVVQRRKRILNEVNV